MKNVLILLLMALCISPAMAEKPRLRGPSSRPTRIVYVNNMGCHSPHCRSYLLKRHSRRYSHILHSLRQIIIIVQTPKAVSKKAATKPKAIHTQHKTIHIGSQPRRTIPRTKTRNQILKESRAKVRS